MGYFEEQQGLASAEYSTEFLAIDALAGPWLNESQRQSIITQGNYGEWDFEGEQGVIRFKSGDQVGVVAQVEILGTYSPDNGLWLWAWSNPSLLRFAKTTIKLRDDHPEIPEFTEGAHTGSEAKAWALAAAAAYTMKAEGCYRLTGEVHTFVALFQVTQLPPAEVAADPQVAMKALAEYAGPMALNIGGLLIASLEHHNEGLDPIIETLYGFCDNLEELSRSPVGQGTAAANEACQLAQLLRQGALCLSLPPGSGELREGITEMLALLKDVAHRYGAWSEDTTT